MTDKPEILLRKQYEFLDRTKKEQPDFNLMAYAFCLEGEFDIPDPWEARMITRDWQKDRAKPIQESPWD